MGIRYYAYAFDAALTSKAVDDPFSMCSSDPLADAWGFEPHAAVGYPTFEQAVPKVDMLYLDKAWRALQSITADPDAVGVHPAFRMFEGAVTMSGYGWDPWVRTILPSEVPAIRDGVCAIDAARIRAWSNGQARWGHPVDQEESYISEFVTRAKEFTTSLADHCRGMVYLIQ